MRHPHRNRVQPDDPADPEPRHEQLDGLDEPLPLHVGLGPDSSRNGTSSLSRNASMRNDGALLSQWSVTNSISGRRAR